MACRICVNTGDLLFRTSKRTRKKVFDQYIGMRLRVLWTGRYTVTLRVECEPEESAYPTPHTGMLIHYPVSLLTKRNFEILEGR